MAAQVKKEKNLKLLYFHVSKLSPGQTIATMQPSYRNVVGRNISCLNKGYVCM